MGLAAPATTTFDEDDFVPISALQHLLFCERQCALIHIERLWADNRLTVEGHQLHERAHVDQVESRSGVRVARGLPLRSLRLGLVGQADVVEFHVARVAPQALPTSFPIEYKRGRPKCHSADRVQLCAQALCLEEMLGAAVPRGALFYGKMRRRDDVEFNPALRELTESAAARVHALLRAGVTPRGRREKKCDRCSLLHLCLPHGVGVRQSVASYLARVVIDDASPESHG